MTIELLICPCCNGEMRVNVPRGREIAEVFIPSHILSPLTRKHHHCHLCPRCQAEVYIRFEREPSAFPAYQRD